MSLTNALRTSLSGLNVNQRELELVANNIANASTVGYTRKSVTTTARVAGDVTIGVSIASVNRALDEQVQKQWRTATGANEYTGVRSDMMTRLDALFGQPGSDASVATIFSQFTSALEALTTTPESGTTRATTVASAATLASILNSLTDQVQTLRQEAETALKDLTGAANDLLQQIALLDKKIVAANNDSIAPVDLLDQRDAAIDKLSQLMDVRVTEVGNGKITLATGGGALLYDAEPVRLEFDARGVVSAESAWSSDPSKSTLGTLKAVSAGGHSIDLFATNAITSGAIAGYRSMRDDVLVKAQAQLDEFASQMALALSNRTEAGEAVAVGAEEGFDLDTADLLEGNTLTLTYKEGGVERTVTFVATDGTASLDDDYTARAGDTVVGIDITGGAASIATQIAAALGSSFSVSNPSGDVIRILDDGAAGTIDITAFDASVAVTDAKGGHTALALFVDSASSDGVYTGLIDGKNQKTGLAGRIVVNPDVAADPSLLVDFTGSTAGADPTRPKALIEALTQTTVAFSAKTGIGSIKAPFSGSVDDFLTQIISTQGAQASQAQSVAAGQQIVTTNLQERYDDSTGVNVDIEMARLIELQTAYQANARVMQAVQDMIDTLFSI